MQDDDVEQLVNQQLMNIENVDRSHCSSSSISEEDKEQFYQQMNEEVKEPPIDGGDSEQQSQNRSDSQPQ